MNPEYYLKCSLHYQYITQCNTQTNIKRTINGKMYVHDNSGVLSLYLQCHLQYQMVAMCMYDCLFSSGSPVASALVNTALLEEKCR